MTSYRLLWTTGPDRSIIGDEFLTTKAEAFTRCSEIEADPLSTLTKVIEHGGTPEVRELDASQWRTLLAP